MKNIIVYSGPLCNFCEAAKRLLARNNLSYKEIDISIADSYMLNFPKRINASLYFSLFKPRYGSILPAYSIL